MTSYEKRRYINGINANILRIEEFFGDINKLVKRLENGADYKGGIQMTKMCDLSESVRKAIVRDVSDILQYRYHIDKESIDEFWSTVQIGVEARRMV